MTSIAELIVRLGVFGVITVALLTAMIHIVQAVPEPLTGAEPVVGALAIAAYLSCITAEIVVFYYLILDRYAL